MNEIFFSKFASLVRQFEHTSPNDLLNIFLSEFGEKWATDVTRYVPEEAIKHNRPEYHRYYFNLSIPISGRSDPRSGMFRRNPDREGGKIEILLHMALGIEGFSEILRIPRAIDGLRGTVDVNGNLLPIEKTPFEDDFERIYSSFSDPEFIWNDLWILPSFEDALIRAKKSILLLAESKTHDENALFSLSNVMLCGAHCPRENCRTAPDMAKIITVSGAMRHAANALIKSIDPSVYKAPSLAQAA